MDSDVVAVEKMITKVAQALVDDPDEVAVKSEDGDRELLFVLNVADDDMGHVIGRGGRVAGAIRQLVRAAARERDLGRVGLKITEA